MTINAFFGAILFLKESQKQIKKKINNLDYKGIKFPMSKEDFSKIETKNNIELMCFVMKINWLLLSIYHIKSLRIVCTC